MSGVFEVDFVSRLFLKKKNKRNGVKGGVLSLDKERKYTSSNKNKALYASTAITISNEEKGSSLNQIPPHIHSLLLAFSATLRPSDPPSNTPP